MLYLICDYFCEKTGKWQARLKHSYIGNEILSKEEYNSLYYNGNEFKLTYLTVYTDEQAARKRLNDLITTCKQIGVYAE